MYTNRSVIARWIARVHCFKIPCAVYCTTGCKIFSWACCAASFYIRTSDCFDQDFNLNIHNSTLRANKRSQNCWFQIQVENFIFISVVQYVFVVASDEFFTWRKLFFRKVMGIGRTLSTKTFKSKVYHSYITSINFSHQRHCLFCWLRNPVKVLFVPITEAQMDELQGLSEQGCLKASVFVTPGYLCILNKSPKNIRICRAQIMITIYVQCLFWEDLEPHPR